MVDGGCGNMIKALMMIIMKTKNSEYGPFKREREREICIVRKRKNILLNSKRRDNLNFHILYNLITIFSIFLSVINSFSPTSSLKVF